MYDIVYIGTSIPILFYIYFHLNQNENILILNKEKYYGGSWFTYSNKYCKNFDTAGHFIVIRNKENMDKVLSLFKSIGVELCFQKAEIFNPNYKFIYDSLIFYPKEGWDKLITALVNKINRNIFLDTEVLDININDNVTLQIKTNNMISYIETNKVVIPSYIKLDQIKIKDRIIQLDYELCNTYHVIFYCKISNSYKYSNSYHGFYEGNLIFDRLTCVCNIEKMKDIKNVNQLLIFRVSRSYKDKILKMKNKEIINKFYDFIEKKKIILEDLVIKDLDLFTYSFYYRQNKIKILIKEISQYKNIELIDTTDLGSLIEKCLN